MPRLLRRLSNPLWAQYLSAPEWDSGDCPPKILADLVAKDGISTWQIPDGWDIRRTIAAIAVGEKSVRDFVYAIVEEKHIRAIGIEIKQQPGETVDSEVNKSHRDLVQVTAHKVAKLARLFRDEDHQVLAKDEILVSASGHFRNGYFDKKKFAMFQRKSQGDLIETFLVRDLLRFV